jgi:hypothetical protein
VQDMEFVVQQAEDSGIDEGPIPDDTMATATLMATEIKEATFQGETEPTIRMRWKFRIDDQAYLDRYVWGSTGTKVVNHPNCKIYSWAQAVLGIDPLPLDYRFTQQDLWQRPCRILIGTREGKDKKTGADKTYNYVEDVLPMSSAATVPAYVPDLTSDEEPF